MTVSIFKDKNTVTNPKYSTADLVLESIRKCNVQKQIDEIRLIKDDEKLKKLKKGKLPNICFSGKFSARYDKDLLVHSGLAIMDIDHIGTIEQVEMRKQELKSLNYIYSCFVSPSGDGLKVLIRIPPIKEKHRGHYNALMQIYPQSDSTSINESRVCYASCDGNIYVNKEAIEFTDFLEIKEKTKIEYPKVEVKGTDYFKINIAANMVRQSGTGANDKHGVLLKAAKLLGGYIQSGVVDESESIRILEQEISQKDIDDFEGAKKTIRDGIEYGKRNPIFETEEFKKYKPKKEEPKIVISNNLSEFVADKTETDVYIDQIRNGTFQMGLTTGFDKLDTHWRFKPANLVIVNGHDNVGKSVLLWYLAVLSALLHDWKWIIHGAENKLGGIKRKLVEFYKCKHIKDYSPNELQTAMAWVEQHFTLIKNNDLFTYKELLEIGSKINADKKHNAMLIDPYNSLYFPPKEERHEWDYRAVSEMRVWIKQNDCSVFLNCHAITEALRRKYPKGSDYEGHPMPPDKADTEGGGKFSNRADDFLTIHRLVYHADEWMNTQIHVKKIKEMETGGMPTQMEEPVKLKSIKGAIGFEDVNGYNPILDGFNKIQIEQTSLYPEQFTEPKKDNYEF